MIPRSKARSAGRRLPFARADGRPLALVEVVILLVALLIFTRVHAVIGRDVVVATAHAHALESVERTLHLNIELSVNAWLVDHPVLIKPAVYFYRTYYVVVVGVLVWVFVRHRELYRTIRRTLLAMIVLVLPVYWAFPLSPPRFALPGVVDIVAEHDLLGRHASRDVGNDLSYSAMPSLHVGWSAWCAYTVWSVLRASHPRAALLAWIFPVVMTAVVLTTGNHYVLDVVGSAVLLAAAVAAASIRPRRPAG